MANGRETTGAAQIVPALRRQVPGSALELELRRGSEPTQLCVVRESAGIVHAIRHMLEAIVERDGASCIQGSREVERQHPLDPPDAYLAVMRMRCGNAQRAPDTLRAALAFEATARKIEQSQYYSGGLEQAAGMLNTSAKCGQRQGFTEYATRLGAEYARALERQRGPVPRLEPRAPQYRMPATPDPPALDPDIGRYHAIVIGNDS